MLERRETAAGNDLADVDLHLELADLGATQFIQRYGRTFDGVDGQVQPTRRR